MRLLSYALTGLTGLVLASAAALPFSYGTSSLRARQNGSLPSSFQWISSGSLVGAKNDGRGVSGIKDPSIVYYNWKYHVFVSTAQQSGYNLVYFGFTDFNQANNAQFYYLSETPIGTGYRAAPQVLYFAPQGLWYLVYQNGNAAYSTNSDISDPNAWPATRTFYSSQPQIITQNVGSGYWVDMWVIYDSSNCYLVSSDDNGHLYRSQTSLSSFPNGFTNTAIAKNADNGNTNSLFEASYVYHLSSGGYLLIVEAMGSDGFRYFRSWTSSSLSGSWNELAASESNPFASSRNVQFPNAQWTKSISHGEAVRTNVDQTLTISPCGMRYLYRGLDPNAQGNYDALPWKLGD